jgi:hypothetical protein
MPALNSRSCIEIVSVIAQEVYGCAPEMETMCDPEDPAIEFIVVTVNCPSGPAELLEKRLAWHRQIRQVSSELAKDIRLSVIPQANDEMQTQCSGLT